MPSPIPAAIYMTSKNVAIDGIVFTVSTHQRAVTRQNVFFPKKECKSLDKKEINDLYSRASAKHHKLFDLISLTITSEDKLDDTYTLKMLIEHMRSYHAGYEMDDVYKIISWGVYPITDELKINRGSKDLYADYSNISVEYVAKSN
jgi:hypothetical protein